jgi:hypothetical protein
MDVVAGITVAVVTVLVLVGGAVVAGFVVLFRRRGDRSVAASSPAFGFGSAPLDELSARAGSLLVQIDDAVRKADDELGFALAQFGPEQSREYGQVIALSRAKVTEAFRLRQQLDDGTPDSDREKREWTLQIIALCDQANTMLTQQDAAFAGRRRLEVSAAGTVTELRAAITALRQRLVATRATLTRLAAAYAPAVLSGVSGNPGEAESALTEATSAVDAAAPAITGTGVSAVSGTLQQASQASRRAEVLLDAVDRTERDLDAAAKALAELRESARSDLVEAKAARDTAPDAETGRAIIDAMAAVDRALAPNGGPANPVADLDSIGAAVGQLDLALASARNQADRLSHARAAYAGTLVSAASQIAVVRQLIGSGGGTVSARTRLAEAERQYALAQVETEPVAALDTVRRAVTLARDADALARYGD